MSYSFRFHKMLFIKLTAIGLSPFYIAIPRSRSNSPIEAADSAIIVGNYYYKHIIYLNLLLIYALRLLLSFPFLILYDFKQIKYFKAFSIRTAEAFIA